MHRRHYLRAVKLSQACATLIVAISAASVAWAEPGAGDEAPGFLGRTARGDEVQLRDYSGKIVVVSFWASWCAPCLRELPILEGLQQQAGKDRLVVVAVNFHENRQAFQRIQTKFEKAGATLTLAHDAQGHASDAFGVKRLPHMIVIGADGRIAFVNHGYGSESVDHIVWQINSLLAAAPAEGEPLRATTP